MMNTSKPFPAPAGPRHRFSTRVYLAALLLCVDPGLALAQSCPEGRIAEIVYERLKPFGPEATSEEASFGGVFRSLNAIHVRTLPTVVRWELLFREGDCLSDEIVLRESERALRSLPYIVEAEIRSERLDDGTHRVLVRTTDAWALSLGISFTVDDGFSFTGLSVNARNLFGSGTQVGLFRNSWRERQRVGVLGRQPNLFGSRIDATIHGGATRSGNYINQSLFRPYAGELGRNAFRQMYAQRDDYFLYSVDPALGFTQVYLRFEAENWEFSYQRRFGEPEAARFVAGLGVSREEIRFPFGDEGVQIVENDRFDEPSQAPGATVDAISVQANPYSATRVNVTLGFRNLNFLNLIGLDALRASQDVEAGLDLLLTVSPGSRSGGTLIDDVFLRGQGEFGLSDGDVYLQFDGDVQVRGVLAPDAGSDQWRDFLYELNGRVYWTRSERSQLFARAQLAGGERWERPFQLTLGGREAVRGYNEDAYPGRQRTLLTVEERLDLPSLSTGFADVGLVAFADAGKIWSGDVPLAEDAGWKASVGVGFRIGLPAGSPGVLRVDIGTPLTGDRDTRGAVFRIYGELLGILDRRSWPTQVERSRWYGVDSDMTVRPVNPLAGN